MSRASTAFQIALAAVVLAALASFDVVTRAQAAAAGVLVLGVIALAALVQVSFPPRSPERSAFEDALRRTPHPPRRPPDLAHVELDLAVAADHRARLGARIVPLVRDVVDARAAVRAWEVPPAVARFLEDPEAATLPGLRAALDALEEA